jgi:RNA polymerase sigma-70 factor (ECF subfamily)
VAVAERDLDTDANLVIAAQAGDDEAFAELFRRHYPSVRRACARRMHSPREADELAQAAFVRAWERIDRCTGERRFGGWVQVIASNLCVDAMRERSRLTLFNPTTNEADLPQAAGPEEVILRDETVGLVHSALADLPPRQRDVVVARDLERRRTSDIAAALGLSVGAVDSLLLRGRRRLAAAFERLSSETGAATSSASTSAALAGGATVGSGRILGLARSVANAVQDAAYRLAAALGAIPGTPSVIERASGAAALGAAIAAATAGVGGAAAPAPAAPVNVPAVAVRAPTVPAAQVAAPVPAAPAAPNAHVDVPTAPLPAVAAPNVSTNPRAASAVADVVDDVRGLVGDLGELVRLPHRR